MKEINPRDMAGNAKEKGEPQRYSWEHRRRKRKRRTPDIQQGRKKTKKVNPGDAAGNAAAVEEEEGEHQRNSWEGRRRIRRDERYSSSDWLLFSLKVSQSFLLDQMWKIRICVQMHDRPSGQMARTSETIKGHHLRDNCNGVTDVSR